MQKPRAGLTAAESKRERVEGGTSGPNTLAPTHTSVRAFIMQSELGTTRGPQPRRDVIYLRMIRPVRAEKRLQGTLVETWRPETVQA